MEVNKEKIRFILQCFFDKGENASHLSEIANGIFDAKDAHRTGTPVVENVDKITEIIEVGRHVSSRSIAQELKIDHKTVLNHLRKFGLMDWIIGTPCLGATPINTKKQDGSNFHL
ncbi:histone-lysine N-methyltransferase SETMAR [Trichonephila clavipes]|nr:histone-lysine N-methyltransferase SETMAR [Trichonephila clavipes]